MDDELTALGIFDACDQNAGQIDRTGYIGNLAQTFIVILQIINGLLRISRKFGNRRGVLLDGTWR